MLSSDLLAARVASALAKSEQYDAARRPEVTDALTIDVVYEDIALLVLNKPSGLLSVPGRGADKQDCLSVRVQRSYPDALIVHRLDMATSGLLLFARGTEMQRLLSMAFASRAVQKRYVAVVHGQLAISPTQEWRLIDLPIGRDWAKRPMQRIDAERGRPSQTRYRVLGYDAAKGATRLELEPVTGRTHQLRVHLQAIGFAILGDQLYAPLASEAMASRLLLHASGLSIRHPVTNAAMAWVSEPPF
jgi:tRNA pseudouridine32 synthase / 23S rRNA pseudouridine746 synthase